MRRIPIRTKLGLALAVPLTAMGVVTLLEVVGVAADADEVRAQTQLATTALGPQGLLTALQNERNWASSHLIGAESQVELEVESYEGTRAATDKARADFERGLAGGGSTAREAYAPALRSLDEITTLRSDVDALAAGDRGFDNVPAMTEIFERYTELIEPFFGSMSRISVAMDDPDLRQGAKLMEAVSRQAETASQLANRLVLPMYTPTAPGDVAGINNPAEIAAVAELADDFRRQSAAMQAATGIYAPVAAEHYPAETTEYLIGVADGAITTGAVDVAAFLAGFDTGLEDAYLGYRDSVAELLDGRADDLNAAASTRQQRLGLLVVVTFGAAVALTTLVSLSITRPLRSLTHQAKDMAERRLPEAVARILETPLGEDVVVAQVEPVRVNTRDEVADVAEALNTVQDSALDLAVEQAVLRRNIADSFVNLGRRNQNLLGRQLDFITELEANETDPDTLANLFRLDHLATRMRRNAESLLVLAGVQPPRTWAAPVRVGDVVRAALGEVESYQRVTVRSVEPGTVLGAAAADLAHLLAELIENALVFSPPDRPVEISGRRNVAPTHTRPGGYTIAVADFGLGMSPDDLAAANRRLAGVESFTVAPSKYLGHYVAGNLAARHGIAVNLHSAPGAGVTATVELPPDLLADEAAAPAAPAAPAATLAPRGPAPSPVAPPAPLPAGPQLPRGGNGRGWPATAPGGPAPVRSAAPAPGPVGTTPPGPSPAPPPLTRRERGAQMPTTAPRAIRRPADTGGVRPVAGGGAAPRAGAGTPGTAPQAQPRPPAAASEVYGFLSNFAAGVQRGRQEARGQQGPWPPDA